MSRLISSMDVTWSRVSVNSKASSNSRCQLLSGENPKPSAILRAAYSFNNSSAMSRIRALMRVFVRDHVAPPIRSSAGRASPAPRNRCTRSMRVSGKYSLAPWAYSRSM